MSEPVRVRGVVVGHGRMAEGLVDAVRQITGAGEDALLPLSNEGLSPEALATRMESRLGDGPAIIFVDLQSGSCGFVARRVCRDRPDSAVLFGVNLPQLLDFVMHRERGVPELVERLLDRGRSAICSTAPILEPHGDRSLPDR